MQALLVLMIVALTGCSSTPRLSQIHSSDDSQDAAIPLFNKRTKPVFTSHYPLSANISQMNISRDGKRAFVSTSAPAQVFWLDLATKRMAHRRELKQAVKGQAILHSGPNALSAISTYSDDALLLDGSLHTLWSHEHLGKPAFLSSLSGPSKTNTRVLILNDDDSEPGLAFASYDMAGKDHRDALLSKAGIKGQQLESFVGKDGWHVGTSAPGGKFLVFDALAQFKGLISESSEIVSAALTSQLGLRVFLLLDHLVVAYELKTDGKFEKVWSRDVAKYGTILVEGTTVFLYGAHGQTQELAALTTDGDILWTESVPKPGLFASPTETFVDPSTGEAYLVVALVLNDPENVTVAAVNGKGQSLWVTSVPAPNGLFGMSYSAAAKALLVGAGEPGRGVLYLQKFAP